MSREWRSSSVWAEFEKTAAESGLITPDLTPDQEHIHNRQKDVPTGDEYTRHPKTEDYGVTEGDGKDLIEKAHPEDAQVAHSMGKGGLVENEVQQQETDVDVATKMPNGALHGVHADVIQNLVKLANSLDEKGQEEASRRVDAAIKEIRDLPFVNSHLHKEAAWFLPLLGVLGTGTLTALKGLLTLKGAAIAGGVIGGLKLFGAKLTSQVNNLSTDVSDLYKSLMDSADDSKSAKLAAQILAPYNASFSSIDISTEPGYKEFTTLAHKLKADLPKISRLMLRIKEDYQLGVWEKMKGLVGLESADTIKAAYDDLNTSLTRTLSLIAQGHQTKEKINVASESASSTPLLTSLKSKNPGDELDRNTVETLTQLEKSLTSKLAKHIKDDDGKEYNFVGQIVNNGTLIMDVSTLAKIIELSNQIS